jgi:hypothetical protein
VLKAIRIRASLQSLPKNSTNASTTVEERRFSAA